MEVLTAAVVVELAVYLQEAKPSRLAQPIQLLLAVVVRDHQAPSQKEATGAILLSIQRPLQVAVVVVLALREMVLPEDQAVAAVEALQLTPLVLVAPGRQDREITAVLGNKIMEVQLGLTAVVVAAQVEVVPTRVLAVPVMAVQDWQTTSLALLLPMVVVVVVQP